MAQGNPLAQPWRGARWRLGSKAGRGGRGAKARRDGRGAALREQAAEAGFDFAGDKTKLVSLGGANS